MTFSLILTSLILLSILVLGGLAVLKNPKNKANRLFALLVFFLSVWIISNFLENELMSSTLNAFFLKLDFSSAAFLAYFWFVFCLNFPKKNLQLSRKKEIFLLLPSIIFGILSFTNLIICNIRYENILKFDFGKFYAFYAIYALIYFLGGSYKLIIKYKKSTGIERTQTLYVLLGFSLSSSIALIVNLFLQKYLPVELFRIGIYGLVFFVGFTTYAITRYHLMDIRIAIRRSAVYFLTILFIYSFFYFAVWIEVLFFGSIYTAGAYIFGVFLAVVFAFLFFSVQKNAKSLANKYFFGNLSKQHETIKKLTQKLITIIDVDELANTVANVIKKTLEVDSIVFIAKDAKKYRLVKIIGFKKSDIASLLKKNDIAISYLEKKPKILTYEEMTENKYSILKEDMKKINASLILPLALKNTICGFIILGTKIKKDAFSQEDIILLSSLANQSALALENAKVYDNLEHFNDLLKEKVDEQTKNIREKNVELKKLVDMKSEFLTIASHQLRTPVSAIKGLVSMFSDGDFDDVGEDMKKYMFNGIFRKTQKMTKIMDDILTATELDTAENFKLSKKELESIDIGEITEKVIDDLKHDAKEKDVKISFKSKKQYNVLSDDIDLKHILVNLLENAVVYSSKGGGIEVSINSESKGKMIKWAVKDSGIGVPKASQKDIFKKFKRGKNANTRNCDGSGLGLFIVKKLVEAHPKGEVGFESNKTEGSTFWIKLPAA